MWSCINDRQYMVFDCLKREGEMDIFNKIINNILLLLSGFIVMYMITRAFQNGRIIVFTALLLILLTISMFLISNKRKYKRN